MKVSELITMLRDFPKDSTVVLASDEEGNQYFNVGCLPEIGKDEDGNRVVIIYPEYPEVYLQ